MAGKVVINGANALAIPLRDYLNTGGNFATAALLKVAADLGNWNIDFGDLVPADFEGYDAVGDLAFSIGAAVGEAYPIQSTSAIEWTVTGLTNLPQTIFGAAVFNSDLPNLWWVENFDSPIVLASIGQVIRYTPRLLFGNCP